MIPRSEVARLRWALASIVALCVSIPGPAGTSARAELGKSECAYCKMIIFDKRFGGEIETRWGEILFFDAIECIAASYYRHWNVPASDVKAIRFVNFEKPEARVAAAKAKLVRTSRIISPMGLNILAVSSRKSAKALAQDANDTVLTWDETVRFVKDWWRLPPPSPR